MPPETDKARSDQRPDQRPDQGRPADAPDQSGPDQPGDEMLDMNRTPGDGSLQGSTPAGLTVDQLLERAKDTDGTSQPGTG
ncbi:MAG TPA: hypothetical protein VGE72_21480 [Azospirillum sp.]